MSMISMYLKELEQESLTTRKMLSIIPNDKYDWQPHPKSMTIRSLATHIAELPTWINLALTTEELDFAAAPYNPEIFMKQSKAETVHHSLCQIIHHRAQLGVCLRLLDVPIPGSYGPSADEMNF